MALSQKTSVPAEGTCFNSSRVPLSFEDQSIPLVKIYTCGGLRIEVLQHPADALPQAQYGSPSSLSLDGCRGVPSQMLLKHLLSAPNHYRSLDWLKEHWSRIDEDRIPTRFDNRTSSLRGILCPSYLQGEQREICRRQLVSLVGGSVESGNGYRLGTYPLIWIDIDALDWNVQQACRMERYGDDSLFFWERVYQLASQGIYLPEEMYSDWAEPRRTAVMGALRQSVHALKRLYPVRYGEQGQAEVMRMLRDYLLQCTTDEDALRTFMELLGQQERFQEVTQMFERTKRSVEEEGYSLDARTVDMWEYLHTKQLHRQHMGTGLEINSEHSHQQNGRRASLDPSFIRVIAEGVVEGIMKAVARLEQQEIQADEKPIS